MNEHNKKSCFFLNLKLRMENLRNIPSQPFPCGTSDQCTPPTSYLAPWCDDLCALNSHLRKFKEVCFLVDYPVLQTRWKRNCKNLWPPRQLPGLWRRLRHRPPSRRTGRPLHPPMRIAEGIRRARTPKTTTGRRISSSTTCHRP